MSERRYTDDEAASIFERAAEAEAGRAGHAPRPDGRSLAELQAIGAEAGIPAELVARAARSLDLADGVTARSFLGFPLAVGQTVELDRRLTDTEWERLVGDLRMTFGARGRVRSDGAFRQWSNGNLQALLEPTETGHRFRLRTLKGDARSLMNGGIALLLIALAVFLVSGVTGGVSDDWSTPLLLAVLGLGTFGAGALRLPGWAGTRRQQIEQVIERLVAATSPSAAADHTVDAPDDAAP